MLLYSLFDWGGGRVPSRSVKDVYERHTISKKLKFRIEAEDEYLN